MGSIGESAAYPVKRGIHATAVAVNGQGVIIFGPPGSGKSDLALRLIDRGHRLIADDHVLLALRNGELHLDVPATIAGMIEVRGLGIVQMPHIADVRALLAVELVKKPERMPEPTWRDIGGKALALIRIAAFEVSAAYKVELAVAQAAGNMKRVS